MSGLPWMREAAAACKTNEIGARECYMWRGETAPWDREQAQEQEQEQEKEQEQEREQEQEQEKEREQEQEKEQEQQAKSCMQR